MATSFDGPLVTSVAVWIVFLISLSGSRLASSSKKLPDHPNHRSSHDRVTSKAGGLAIIAAWLAGIFVIGAFSGFPDTARQSALLAGLTIIALGVGLADDRLHISPFWKCAGQFAVAGMFVAAFSPLATAPVPFVGEQSLGLAGVVLTVFWIVAFMNIFNFMDGANGLAAGAATIGLCGFSVVASFTGVPFAAIAGFLLAVATLGFMPSNLKRGRLFMGDNGSQAVSFLIAALAILAANESNGRMSALVTPVIFLPFVFDVFWTLAHRVIRRKNILAAHREHLYQLMLRSGASHMRVAVIYMTLTAASTATAIFMLTLTPALQWIAPAVLSGLFAIGAMRIHMVSYRAGLFAETERHAETSENGESALQAAE